MPIYSANIKNLRDRQKSRLTRHVRRTHRTSLKKGSADCDGAMSQGFLMHRATLSGTGFLSGLFFIVLLGLVGSYVGVMNASAVRGAQVRDLEQQITALESERGELEIRAAHLRAQAHAQIAREEEALQRLGLSQYIEIVDESTIASR